MLLGKKFVEMTGDDLSKETNAIDLLKRPNINFSQIAESQVQKFLHLWVSKLKLR